MEKDKDVIEIIVDEPENQDTVLGSVVTDTDGIIEESDGQDSNNGGFDNLKQKLYAFLYDIKTLPASFFAVSSSVCAVIIVLSLAAGIFIPKSEGAVNSSLERLKKTDNLYLSAKAENTDMSNEVAQLNDTLEEKRNDLEMFSKSKDSLDKITQENEELTQERDELQNEVNSKQIELERLNALYGSSVQTTVTLTSGRYTVGENIAPGTYTVTGNGSIAIGKSRINANLTSSGKEYTLNDGESIKIDGNAKFILKQ